MAFNFLQILLFGPGVRFVPEVVWRSKFFWIAIAVMTVGILLYHNYPFKKMGNGNFIIKRFGFSGKNAGGAKVSYSSEGRSGHVQYQGADAKFALYYEFGGGDCVASIKIPSFENWEKETKILLARRDEILNFIGRQVVKDQTSGGLGSFKIEGDWLNIYA